MDIDGKEYAVRGRLVRIARLAAEGFVFIENPEKVACCLRACGRRVDILTFMQRLPETSPKFQYSVEWDNLAVLPVSTYEDWWNRKIDGKTRNMVRRAEKKGVLIREVPYDDALVRALWNIYNETPVRQGRPFPHYGKSLENVRNMTAMLMVAPTTRDSFWSSTRLSPWSCVSIASPPSVGSVPMAL